MKPVARTSAIVVFGLAAVLVIVWATSLRDGGRGAATSVSRAPVPEGEHDSGSRPLPRGAVVGERAAADEAPTALVPLDAESLGVEEDARPGTPLLIQGTVLEGRTLAPLEGATVQLFRDNEAVRAETDERGRFGLTLDQDAWTMGETYRARIGTERMLLFSGSVVLEPELLIHARLRFDLRGRLISNIDPATRLYVHAFVPAPTSESPEVFAGRSQLASDGEFAIEAWTDTEIDSFLIQFGDERGFFLVTEVATERLLAPGGATIECDVGEMILEVVDGEHEPVAGADVRLSFAWEVSTVTWVTGRTDARGSASFLLPSGAFEFCVGKPGHAFATGTREWRASADRVPFEIVLARLGAQDMIEGHTVDAAGEPVAGAYVTAGPLTADREISVAATVGIRTDESGAFRLEIGRSAELEVTAFRRDLGSAPAARLAPGETTLTLRFDPLGILDVHLTDLPSDGAAKADRVEWFLSAGGRSGVERAAPFQIDEVPLGLAELWVRSLGGRLFGSATVLIEGGAPQRVSLSVQRYFEADGVLLDGNGAPVAGAELRLDGSSNPKNAPQPWRSTVTDEAGRFRAFLGASPSHSYEAWRGQDLLGTFEFVDGTGVYHIR